MLKKTVLRLRFFIYDTTNLNDNFANMFSFCHVAECTFNVSALKHPMLQWFNNVAGYTFFNNLMDPKNISHKTESKFIYTLGVYRVNQVLKRPVFKDHFKLFAIPYNTCYEPQHTDLMQTNLW